MGFWASSAAVRALIFSWKAARLCLAMEKPAACSCPP